MRQTKVPHLTFYPIEDQIFWIRGCHVMLDSDLARLYEVPVKRLNEQASRNRSRFPENFAFQLLKEEYEPLRSQIATSNSGHNSLKSNDLMSNPLPDSSLRSQFATSNSSRGGRRHLPWVFTEQGVAMLSAVLNSEQAINVSIAVINSFVFFRKETTRHENKVDELSLSEGRLREILSEHTKTVIESLSREHFYQETSYSILENSSFLIPSDTESKVQVVLSQVAQDYNVKISDLKKSTRKNSVVIPRQMAMYLMREKLNLSLSEIAEFFAKDHSTVLYAVRKMQKLRDTQKDMAEWITDLILKLNKMTK